MEDRFISSKLTKFLIHPWINIKTGKWIFENEKISLYSEKK
ncbi:MAG: hypothetical protein RLZZ417_76 [Bacteroidota bacterium]|jgi:hypothetical protein